MAGEQLEVLQQKYASLDLISLPQGIKDKMNIGVINKASATVVEDELRRKRNDMADAL